MNWKALLIGFAISSGINFLQQAADYYRNKDLDDVGNDDAIATWLDGVVAGLMKIKIGQLPPAVAAPKV